MDPQLRSNALLSLLDDPALEALNPLLEPISLPLDQELYAESGPMTHAWFPGAGVISVLGGGMASQLEVGTIGREGVLGVPLFLGATHSTAKVYVQVPGWGWRMRADDFRTAVTDGGPLSRVLHSYSYAFLVQTMQGSACNSLHPVEQRCARWLLQTHERVPGDEFELKQEALGQMLGERRATVSKVASQLQAQGLIQYSRGRIRILDLQGLRALTCSCYQIVRGEYDRMLGRSALLS